MPYFLSSNISANVYMKEILHITSFDIFMHYKIGQNKKLLNEKSIKKYDLSIGYIEKLLEAFVLKQNGILNLKLVNY